LLQGHTLDQRMPLPPQRAIGVALAVADGLEYLHANGYVHGDIKPANIMLVQEQDRERVVLLDFGLAQANGPGTTTLLATPHYLAPERASGAPPSAAADLYALGIVLYEMLAGRLPFVGDSPMAVAIQQIQQPPPPPRQFNPAITPMLETVILNALSKDPQQRPASARLFAMALRDVRLGRAQPTVPYATPSTATTMVVPPVQPTRPVQPSRTASAPTVVNEQPVRRPQPSQYAAPPRTNEYDNTVPGNYTLPPRSTPPYNAAPPAPPRRAVQRRYNEPRYDEPAPARYEQPASRGGISGNLVATLFLLLGLAALFFLTTTNAWIEPVRQLVGF